MVLGRGGRRTTDRPGEARGRPVGALQEAQELAQQEKAWWRVLAAREAGDAWQAISSGQLSSAQAPMPCTSSGRVRGRSTPRYSLRLLSTLAAALRSSAASTRRTGADRWRCGRAGAAPMITRHEGGAHRRRPPHRGPPAHRAAG